MVKLKKVKKFWCLSVVITQKTVKAATLIEVIISLVIIMLVFVMAIGIFTRITQSGIAASSILARNKMNDILQETISQEKFEQQTLEEDSIIYRQTIADYPDYPDILVVQLEAIQNGKSLGKIQQLVKMKTDEQ